VRFGDHPTSWYAECGAAERLAKSRELVGIRRQRDLRYLPSRGPSQTRSVGVVILELGPVKRREAGYCVVRDHRRLGYASRALRLGAECAIGTRGWARVQLWTESDNVA